MYPGTYALTQPDKPAVIQPSTGQTLTFKELNDLSNQFAHVLYDHGIRPRDHVAVFMENTILYFPVVWACLRSGLYVTPINRHLTASEAAYIVDNCDATALIASAALEHSVELGKLSPRCTLKLSVGGKIEGFDDFHSTIKDKPTSNIADQKLGNMMLYSSGTTGKPKGILRSPTDAPVEDGSPSLKFMAQLFQFGNDSVYLSTAPLYHGSPLGTANAAIQTGATVVLMDKFDAETALQNIEKYRVTHSQWVPTMFIRMLKLPEEIKNRYDLSSMKVAVHAAAPCPVDVKHKMIEWWGPVINEFYSSTETAGMARIGSKEWLEHPGSVGRNSNNSFHICDEEGNELPPGESGLIYGEVPVGPQFVYHKDPEKTKAAIHPTHPNWITVGDIGLLDEQGYLFLTDRKSFMIISGGVNIYPQQIEDALALYPGITDLAVIGVPNEDLGEEVKAVIQLDPGVEPSASMTEQIKTFVTVKLGKQLTPRSIDFVDELPRTPMGKLNKKELRAKYWPSK